MVYLRKYTRHTYIRHALPPGQGTRGASLCLFGRCAAVLEGKRHHILCAVLAWVCQEIDRNGAFTALTKLNRIQRRSMNTACPLSTSHNSNKIWYSEDANILTESAIIKDKSQRGLLYSYV